MRAGVEPGNPVSPLLVKDQADFTNPDYAPQLLRHEQTHRQQANWPEKLQQELPPINSKDPYNYGGVEGIERIGSNPMKLSTEQMASAEQHLQADKQNGNVPEPLRKLDENFQAVPLSVMEPTDPHGKGINTTPRTPGLPMNRPWGTEKLLEADDTIPVKPGSGQAPWEKYASSPASGPWEKYSTSAPAPPSANPQATVSAGQPEPWLNQAEDDLRGGGNKTIVGRVLGRMQGNGNKGYSGLESGVSPETANFMGSPELGTIHALQGEDETLHGHPLSGGWKTIKGIGEAATIPGLVMGGPEAEGAMNLIPSKSHAAGVLNDIEDAAKNVPVSLTETHPAIGDYRQAVATGGRNSPVMTKFIRRTGASDAEPLLFPEARDFYTNISRATAKPGLLRRAIESPMMPSFRMNAGNVWGALNSDLTDAADIIGRGPDYTGAMNEYKNAARLVKGLKVGGSIAAAEALHKSGLLGKAAGGVMKVTQ